MTNIRGGYDKAILQNWAEECKTWQKEGKEVYIYFDNDQEGYAGKNAKELLEMVKGSN